MSFNKYYQDELAYLREMGKDFARRYPETGGMLAEPGADPDVERLLEGFAFLTARIRGKLDDELPEFTHALLELFWPHYLRPFPAATIVQFTPLKKAFAKLMEVPAGAELASRPIDGTACTFRTTTPVELAPLRITDLQVGPSSSPFVRLVFEPLAPGALPKLELTRLRLFLAGELNASRALRLCLLTGLRKVSLKAGSGEAIELPQARAEAVGLEEAERLLPVPDASFGPYQLLHEYCCFPSKFSFVDLCGLDFSQTGGAARLELLLELDHYPQDMPPLTRENVQLNCAPATNLFEHDADPIVVDHTRSEYKVRPAGKDATHFEVFSVDSVVGLVQGKGLPRNYAPFFSFARRGDGLLYKARRADSMTLENTDVFLSFPGQEAEVLADKETLSLRLTCTNRQLPRSLGIGEICEKTATSPAFASFENLVPPTPAVPPPLSGDVYWTLMGHLSLNYLSLLEPERLRELLGIYHFRAHTDRQAAGALRRRQEGILAVRSEPSKRLLDGCVVRGVEVEVDVDEERFGSEGEAHLFGDVLERFLAHYVSLNAYSRLRLKGTKFGEVHQWPARSGEQCLL